MQTLQTWWCAQSFTFNLACSLKPGWQLSPRAWWPSDISGILHHENAIGAVVLIWGSNPTRPEVSNPPSPSTHSEVSGTSCPNENYSHEQGLQGGNIKSLQWWHFLALATNGFYIPLTHTLPSKSLRKELLAEINSCGSKPFPFLFSF